LANLRALCVSVVNLLRHCSAFFSGLRIGTQLLEGEFRVRRRNMSAAEQLGHLDKEAFAEKALSIYEQKYKERLEASERGKVVAIEVRSGEAFIGRTVLEAAMKARQKFPDRLFYFVRVGYPAVHSLKGASNRVVIPQSS